MKKKSKPKILYTKYLEEHKEELERQELEEKLNTDAVIVNKLTAGAKTAQLIGDIIRNGFKILFTLIIMGLLSLAVTVLINEPLRKVVFEYFGFIN